MKMMKCKNNNLMTSHFGTLYGPNSSPISQKSQQGFFFLLFLFVDLHTVTSSSVLPFRISLSVTSPDDSNTEYVAELNSTESDKMK